MGSIKFNTNRTKVDLTGVTETESSTLSGKGKQTAVLPTYKPNFKDVNLTTIQAQARTPVFKSVTTPRKYTTPTKKPKIELPKYTPFTNEEVGLLQHQTRLPMALPKSNLTSKVATNTEYALKSNPTAYGFMEGLSPLPTKTQLQGQIGQSIDTTGAEDTLGYKLGYGAGLMGQYMITGGIAHAGVRAGLTKAIPQLAQNAGRSTAKNVLGVMGASALADVLTGVPINTVQALKESTIDNTKNNTIESKGNIDLYSRPQIKNPDGSISTVYSMTFTDDEGKFILVAGVRDGLDRVMTEKEAWDHYNKTGEYLGKFDTLEEADDYAEKLHQQQDAYYTNTSSIDWNQFAKSFAVNTAIDVVFGGLIEGGLVLKSGKKIKTVGDLKTVTPDESKEITEQLMLNSPKYKENLMLNAPTNKLLNIPQKQLTHPVNYVDELGNISNEPNFNAAKNVLQEEPYVKNKIKVTVKRPSGTYEKIDDDWDFGWDGNDINLINGWIEFSKSNGKNPTKLLKSQLNKTQIEIDKAFDEAKDYFLNYKGKGVDLVEMVDLPGRKVRESLNDEWYRRWYKKNKKVPTKKDKLQIAEEEFMEDIRAASDGNRDGEFVSEELAKRYSLFNKLENMFNKLPDDTINVELRGVDDMSALLGQETRIVKPDYTKKPFIERVETPKRVYAGELPQGAKLPERTLSKKIAEQKAAEPIILGGKVEEPPVVKPTKVAKAEPKVDTAKPEGLFVDYYPEKRAVDVIKSNDYHQITKEADYKPDDSITVYRGAPDTQSKIVDGDWVTTSKQLAKDYAGTGKVIEDKIAAKYLYASKGEGIEELIYSTKATKIPTKFKSVEAELKSLTAEMKATPPTETQIKRYKQLKAQVKPAKIPTREPVSTVEPVKSAKPTLTPKTEKNIPNAVKTDNPYLNTITNVTEKTKAEKRLGENITFVNNKGNLTKATRKEYIEDMAMIDGSQIKTTQKLRTNGGKTFEVNEYRVYKTPNSKEPIKISKYEKDYFDFAKKNQPQVTLKSKPNVYTEKTTFGKQPFVASPKTKESPPKIKAEPKIDSKPEDMVMASSRKAGKSRKEKIVDTGLETKRQMVDAGDTVAVIGKITGDEGLYHSYNNARNADRRAENMIGNRQTDINGKKVGESLESIFKPIMKKGDGYYNDFQSYVLHKLNIERYPQGKGVFGDSTTAKDSIAKSSELLKQYPEFEKYAQKLYKYERNLQQYRIDADLISLDEANAMADMYPSYVKIARVEKTSVPIGSNAKTKTSEKISKTVQGATGDDSKIIPLHESMARQTMKTIKAAENNIFANRLVENASPKTSKYLQDLNVNPSKFDVEDIVDGELPYLKNGFHLFRNGEAYQVKTDVGLFEAIEAISPNAKTQFAFYEAAKFGTTMFKKLVTSYSPPFALKNLLRDFPDALLYSKDSKEFIKQLPNAIREMKNGGELFEQYKGMGCLGSSFFDYARGFKKDSSAIRKHTIDKMEEVNMFLEQIPRFTEFLAILSKGDGSYDSLLKAAYGSADITANFNRKGIAGKAINEVGVPFFNPAMQGADRAIRYFKNTKGAKAWIAVITKATMLGIAPSVINELLLGNDPDYQKLYNRDKDLNYIIKLGGDDNWLRIPKGRVLSVLSGVPQRTVRKLRGEENAYAEFFKSSVEQVAPINPLTDNLYAPIVSAQTNKAWHGGTIIPYDLVDKADYKQFDEGTTSTAKAVGKLLNYSPMKIDYLVDAYSGIIGDLAIPLLTKKAEVHPFIKAFTIDGKTTNKISGDFYDAKDKIADLDDDGDITGSIQLKYLNKQSDMASELYNEISEVENSNLSDVKKRAKVRELRALINVVQQNALDSLPEVEKTTKKLVNKYSDTDDLYREVNREVFGAEYALKTYNKTVYEKAQTYVTEKTPPSFNRNVATIPQKNGVTWDNYYDGYFAQKDEASDISKAIALQGKNITTLYDAFGISDKNANIAAALSKNDLGKAYNSTYQKISDSEATKSAEKIAIIKQNNPTLSTSELRILYEAFNVAESIGRYTRKYN